MGVVEYSVVFQSKKTLCGIDGITGGVFGEGRGDGHVLEDDIKIPRCPRCAHAHTRTRTTRMAREQQRR